jgi:hypothetical protein
MNTSNQNQENTGLSTVLRKARPAPPLPPRFQESVWRRIESQERRAGSEIASPSWLDVLVQRLLQPRWALASLAVLVVAGGVIGAANSSTEHRHQAQARYLSAVAPSSVH